MIKRISLVLALVALLSLALVASGCGGDDSGDDSNPPAATVPEEVEENIPTDADALKEACVKDFTDSGRSQEEAEKMCTVPDESEIDAAVDKAVQSCLDAVKMLPEGEQAQAEQDCRESAN